MEIHNNIQNEQRRKRLWLVYGRICLTLSILGIITFGLYLLSQQVSIKSTADAAKITKSNNLFSSVSQEFLVREKIYSFDSKNINNNNNNEDVKDINDFSLDKNKKHNKFRSNDYKSVNNYSYNKLVNKISDKLLFDSLNENKHNKNINKRLPISDDITNNFNNKKLFYQYQQENHLNLNFNEKNKINKIKNERIKINKNNNNNIYNINDYHNKIINKRSINDNMKNDTDNKNIHHQRRRHHKRNKQIIKPKIETTSDIYLNKTINEWIENSFLINDNINDDFTGNDEHHQHKHKIRHKKQDIIITEGITSGRYYLPCGTRNRICACNRYGAIDQNCNPYDATCKCRIHVEGNSCDRCKEGYWNLMSGKGCEKCNCNKFGSKNQLCNIYNGECVCKEGVTGKECDQCQEGYFGFSHNGCKKCEECLSDAQICDPDTGRCICPPRSKGPDCDCMINTWGWEHKKGCKTCNCNREGSIGQCDPTNGKCQCREGFSGHKCDRCSHGYYGYPDCNRCNCDVRGSKTLNCNDEGKCHCKKSVTGLKCNECLPNKFGLATENHNGCLDCFCFGKTKECSDSIYTWGQIRAPFARNLSVEYINIPYKMKFGFDYVVVIQMQGSQFSREDAEIKSMNGLNLIPKSSGNVSIGVYGPFYDPLYFQLPYQFLNDQVTSYGGYLKFSLTSEGCDSKLDDRIIHSYPLVQIHSHETLVLDYRGPELLEWSNSQERTYEIQIKELHWRHHISNRNITRAELMTALQNIKHIFLRATNTADITQVVLSNVTLDVGMYISGTKNYIANQIEMCKCPEGYSGNSCQDPADGYYRFKNHTIDNRPVENLVGFAIPCKCNGRSRNCDKETGCCINCNENTGGLYCDECAEGYFGDPNIGTCEPCPCPETRKNFAKGCFMNGNDVSCLCKQGYTGLRCEKCIDGYFGSPDLHDGKCEPCDCNLEGTKSDKCDKKTGQCDCMDGIEGLQCDQCKHPRFMLQDSKCKSCDNCTLILLDRLDGFDLMIEDTVKTVGTNITAPYNALKKLEDDVEDLYDMYDKYIEAKEFISELDDVSIDKFISKIENSKNKLNKMLIKTEKRKLESAKRLSDALAIKSDAQQMTKNIKDVTSELSDYASHISHVNIAKALEEAEKLLAEIVKFDTTFISTAEKSNSVSNCSRISFNDVMTIYDVVLDQETTLKELYDKIQNFNSILNDFDKLNMQIIPKLDEANELNLKNKKNMLNDKYNEIKELTNEINHKYLNHSNIIKTEQLLEQIIQNGIDMEHQKQGINASCGFLEDKMKEDKKVMIEVDELIPKVIEHSNNLKERANSFKQLFQKSKVGAEEALLASNAHKTILESITSANKEAIEANEAAKDTKDRINPRGEITILDESIKLLENSKEISEDAREPFNKVEDLNSVLREHEQNVEAIDDTIYRSGIENNRISNETNNSYNDQNTKSLKAALDTAKKISDQMKELRKEATHVNNDVYKLKQKLSHLEPDWDTKYSLAEENTSQSLSNIRAANKKIDGLEIQSKIKNEKFNKINSTMLVNLQTLRDKIDRARHASEGIRVSMLSGDKKCTRSYVPPLFGLSTSTVIKMSIALNSDNENSPLLFIQGDSNKFMALEMVDRKIRLIWNLGGNTAVLVHSEEIKMRDPKYDDAWYYIEANRTMNIGSLVVRQMTNTGHLVNTSIITDYSDSENTFFHINRNSRIWIGAVPENIKSEYIKSEPGLGVIVHQVNIDRNQIGLWNFDYTVGDCKGGILGATETSTTTSERHFNGDGYAKVVRTMKRLYKKTSFTIQMNFKTFDENALMFLAVDEVNNRSVSLTLYEGRIVFRIDYGGESKLEINTTKKYNTGTWVSVEASRHFQSKQNTENGIISVNGEEQAGSPTSPISSYMLPDFSSDLYYLGGVPPGFKSGTTKAPGADHAFLGCMKDVQINRETTDPLESPLHYGIEPSCREIISKAGFFGNGYIELPSHSLRKRGNFGFIFRTLQTDALLLLSTYPPKISSNYDAKDMRGNYSLAVMNGKILLWMNAGNGNLEIMSNGTFNDGEFHVLSVIKYARKVELRIDDKIEAYGNIPSAPFAVNMPEEEGGLYIGGIPEYPEYDEIVPTSTRFNGTIGDVVFNNNTVSFDQTLNFTNVQLGRSGPRMGSLLLKEGETIGKSFKKTPEGCQRVGSYSYEPNAFKFGDGKNSYSIINISKQKFWQHNFLIEFDFRTFYPNGVIFVTPGLNEKVKHYITLTLKDGHLLLTFRGKRKAELKQSPKLNDGQWHHVVIKCVDSFTTINVNHMKGKLNTAHLKLPKKLHLANILSVGGIPENRSSLPKQVLLKLEQIEFKGCIRRLTVNNQTQDLARPDLHRNIGQCFPRVEKGSYFPGDAYAIYNRHFDIGKHLEFKLEFKTSELNGILLSVSEPEASLSLEIFNGNIILSSELGNGIPNRIESNLPSKFALCDNKWHTITALYDLEQIGIRIDEQPFIVGLSQYRVPSMISTKSPLYIGGLPDTASSGTLHSQENFKGCIKNIVIGNDIKDWTDMDELHSVLLSECLTVN